MAGATMTDMNASSTILNVPTTLELRSDDPPMPKLSAAIFVTLAQAIIGLVVAFGFDVSADLQAAIIQLVTVLTVAIPAWDAWVRGNRARYFAAKTSQPTVNVTQENQAA